METLARSLLATLLTVCILPASASEKDVRDSVALGALTFSDNCSVCHQLDGYGEDPLYPSLHNATLLADRGLLIQTILNGRLGHVGNNGGDPERLMPSLAYLTDREIAGIIAFITNSWGDDIVIVSEDEVAEARRRITAVPAVD